MTVVKVPLDCGWRGINVIGKSFSFNNDKIVQSDSLIYTKMHPANSNHQVYIIVWLLGINIFNQFRLEKYNKILLGSEIYFWIFQKKTKIQKLVTKSGFGFSKRINQFISITCLLDNIYAKLYQSSGGKITKVNFTSLASTSVQWHESK